MITFTREELMNLLKQLENLADGHIKLSIRAPNDSAVIAAFQHGQSSGLNIAVAIINDMITKKNLGE